jgi:hypothetical protein
MQLTPHTPLFMAVFPRREQMRETASDIFQTPNSTPAWRRAAARDRVLTCLK